MQILKGLSEYMDVTSLFADTDFSWSSEGRFVAKPSLLENVGHFFVAAICIFALAACAWWFDARFSWSSKILFAFFVFIVVDLGRRALVTLSVQCEIREDKLIVRQGVLSRTMGAVNIARIQNAVVHQTIFERMFAIGTLIVNTNDSTVGAFALKGMRRPDEFRAALLEASERVRKYRQVYEFAAP